MADAPTPIRRHRRYTKVQKAEAVGASLAMGVRAAADKLGVPESTIRRFREDPEMAQLRAETKAEVASDVWGAFQQGVRRISELIPQTDDIAKVAVATGVLYDKFALIAGHATERTETRDVTAKLDDAGLEELTTSIDEWLAARKADAADAS